MKSLHKRCPGISETLHVKKTVNHLLCSVYKNFFDAWFVGLLVVQCVQDDIEGMLATLPSADSNEPSIKNQKDA